MVLAEQVTENALKDSVQKFSDTTYEQSSLVWYAVNYEILPKWGTRLRDRALRDFWHAVHGSLYQSAITGFVNKVIATPWEIKGPNYPKWKTAYFQAVLQNANFGAGWESFISKLLLDWLTQDFGAVVEIIGPGDPTQPLDDELAITGIASLDSLSCGATDNPEYPIVYQSRKKPDGIHVLQRERVARLVDMPDSDEAALDTGLCALSRMISPANVQILMGRYLNEKLNDLPPTGILTVSGVTDKQVAAAINKYEHDRKAAGQNVFRNIMRLEGVNPEKPPQITFTSFSELPDNFDYREYMEIQVNLIAAALGIDRQEFWTLQSGLGTGTQSQILHQKAMGKGYARVLAMIERLINTRVLPAEFEFKFKFQDRDSDKEDADRAQTWVNIAQSLTDISTAQRLQLLANNVPQLADVILDADGQVKLPDTDLRTEPEPSVTAESNTTPGTAENEDATTAGDITPVQKDFAGTADDFGRNFYDLIEGGINNDVNRRRFGTVARAQLRNYGTQAYKDGMEFNGVVDELTADDLSNITEWLAETSEYVTNFANDVYDGGVSDEQIRAHVDMWANKSLRDIFNRGVLAADANAMMQWHYDPQKEHCETCRQLHGQIHRMSAWVERDLLPGSSALDCKGYFCGCELRRTNKRASGSFAKALLILEMGLHRHAA